MQEQRIRTGKRISPGDGLALVQRNEVSYINEPVSVSENRFDFFRKYGILAPSACHAEVWPKAEGIDRHVGAKILFDSPSRFGEDMEK